MSAPAASARQTAFFDGHPDHSSLRDAALAGLSATPKMISPKFFYDRRGSELFDLICEQPEYYPTRTETALLAERAGEIAELAGQAPVLIELGSGASKKIRLLLEALRPSVYIGVDISRDFLLAATARLADDYPWLEVRAACSDFSSALDIAPALTGLPPGARRLAFFPGSSIGNFDPPQALRLLQGVARMLGRDGALLIGVDLKKAPALLDAAYNDGQGVTAAFNKNLLTRLRTELGAELDPDGFRHLAFYNADAGRVEMHLQSVGAQTINVDGRRFDFADGETLHSENSYKYSVEEFQRLAATAGFRSDRVWTDAKDLFSVHYLSVS